MIVSEENKKEDIKEVLEEAPPEDKKHKKKIKVDAKVLERIEELELQNQELQGQVDTLKNEYAKAYADVENIKKRLNNEFDMKNKYRIQDFALEILPVIDNCERALAIEAKDEADEAYRKGFEMVKNQLTSALQKEGVEEIEALDQEFDPNWHQAMLAEHIEGVEAGKVLEVLQKGYKLKDRLLRPAMVKISE